MKESAPTSIRTRAEDLPATYREACSSLRTFLKDRRAHPYVDEHWASCLAVDGYSREELLALRDARFRALVAHVIEHVPYYRQWASEHQIDSPDQVLLSDLPMITKREIASQPEAFRSDQYLDDASLLTVRTSGTTGQPLTFRTHARANDYSYCCLHRALLRHGVRPGDRRVYIWGQSRRFISGRARILRAAKERLRDWMNNTLSISAYELNKHTVASAIDQIDRFQPVYMLGYVSALEIIARHLLDHRRTLRSPRLKLIVTDSEKLHEHQRDIIAKAFNCRVVQHYGSIEFGNIAQEDPDGHLRINEDFLIWEQGENGAAIFTHLLAFAQPFIRYRIGDIVEKSPERPPHLPYEAIGSISGRTADLLPLKSGGYVHGLALGSATYREHPEIRRFQVRQTAIDHLQLTLEVNTPLGASKEEKIRNAIRELTGEDMRISIAVVDEIPPEPSGKFRVVASDVTRGVCDVPGNG